MKIISWNINSLRLRLPLLQKLVSKSNPDVICLQETKVSNAEFPLTQIKALGFDFIEFDGEKSYNGVAIMSKFPLYNAQKIDVLNYGHRRHISVVLKLVSTSLILHNFYVPAGGDIPDPKLNEKFDHKLKFVDWMTEFFTEKVGQKTILLGDLNIAPLPNDVWSHRQLLKIVSHTPIEIEKLSRLQKSLGFIDTHRIFVSENEKLYSWWSYRARDPLGSDKGRRLDHIWISPELKPYLQATEIHREFRSEKQPSDHVPIELVLNLHGL